MNALLLIGGIVLGGYCIYNGKTDPCDLQKRLNASLDEIIDAYDPFGYAANV